MRNGTCILLNIKVPEYSNGIETRQYRTEAIKLVPATDKYEKSLTTIKEILKNY